MAAEGKATYDEIKAYIWEYSELRLSNLYIVQIEQKRSIIERENYNKVKFGDYKQSKCPPEKKVEIMEALKHFGVIASK